MKKIYHKTTLKVGLPKKPSHWPRMETWITLPDGFQNKATGKVLTREQFELHQLNQDSDLVGYFIKAPDQT
jgi:hypothetical protein